MDLPSTLLLVLAVLFIGVSKAGFGGGLGVISTPLTVIAFTQAGKSPLFALGVVLPLLCAADFFSLYHYWGKWRKKNLLYIMPGAALGTLIGLALMGKASPRQINVGIGCIAIGFVVFQLMKERIFKAEGAFEPNHKIGVPMGTAAGITSTFANGAGPVIAMFLIPQRLPKEIYVGTNTLIFTCINLVKLALFVPTGIVTGKTAQASAALVLFVPLGVWAGLWLNRQVSEKWFVRLIYALTFLTGVQLILRG